jgi:hypothetical protein
MPLDVEHTILEKEAKIENPVNFDGFEWGKIKNGKSHYSLRQY